jgi:hypothetical protein
MATTKSRKPVGKKATSRKPAPSPARSRKEDDEDTVTFNLSPSTARTINAALKGLTKKQQDRVLEAIDVVGDEIGTKVGRWIESNFVRNSNELLTALTPILVKDGLWSELRGIWVFLDDLSIKVDHKRIGKAVEKELGAHIAGHYRDVVAGVKGDQPPTDA